MNITSKQPNINRRAMLTAGLTCSLAVAAQAAPPDPSQKLLELIDQLENAEGWEIGSVVWCKAWAANEIRKAMDIHPIESNGARLHVQTQERAFKAEQRRLAEVAEFEARRAGL